MSLRQPMADRRGNSSIHPLANAERRYLLSLTAFQAATSPASMLAISYASPVTVTCAFGK